ncbi:hypothetical protein ATCM_00055 [Stenotrophomonas sp. ATCM1_4]|uniref:hypothetical protein n=1 Tax=Stenotrophomonas sp. ATCM1_4 TaxID=2259330 RepID=UPI001044ED36|nr:hypothetical protein [Stenotrophomonas sp. ATCM1_4]TDB26198.1 hypothetical protein ATCM_00055 [Stenotrophomonas sp. ATCM1_4]
MKIKNKLKKFGAAATTAATTAMVSGAAFAGEFSEAVSAGVDKAELTAIGIVVVTISGIILLIRSSKKAAN